MTTNRLTAVQRFFKMLAADKQDIIYIYIYSIFSGLINLSLPLGIQAIISLIMVGQSSTSWGVLVTAVTIGVAVVGGLKIMQLIITETLQQRIFARSSFEFAYRIPRFKTEAIFKEYPPELVNRFFDTLTVQK
ncbi:MAG: ABC-type bacteriocin/lantibiotic exporter with double-glycine peptidase domain, partial [Saprospiraceae bacterium]